MAAKTSKLFALFSFLLLTLLIVSHAEPKANQRSAYDFIKHLQGCQKGEKVKGMQELKDYLNHFGYLDYHHPKNQQHPSNDTFDDALEAAIKTYQMNYHLKVTGTLDAETVSTMTMSRCGVPDIVNGTNWMRNDKKINLHDQSTFIHTVAHYKFFNGRPRWPPSKTHLTYAFYPNVNSQVFSPVASAFDKWASVTHFTFSQVQNLQGADITIGFFRGNHGDAESFDGPGGIVAHAFAPTNGMFHYDADESWSVGPRVGSMDLETVALHEIGHLLGLNHSDVESAIMFPTIPSGETKGLDADDIEGIKALYNL